MESYKQRRISTIVKEIQINKGQTKYEISGINIDDCKFFYRYKQKQFKDLPLGDYTIDKSGNQPLLEITNNDIINKAEAIQVCYVVDLKSSKYQTDFEVDINKLTESYNKLVDDVHVLWEYVKKTAMVADDTTIDLILPQLNTDEVWIKTDDGYKGISITDAEEQTKDLVTQYTEELKKDIVALKNTSMTEIQEATSNSIQEIAESFNAEVEKGKQEIAVKSNEEVGIITDLVDSKISEITQEGLKQKGVVTEQGNIEISKINAMGIDNKLDKGNYQGNAQSLKDEIDKKQNKQDNTLETTAKEIVPAINEINSLAKKDKGERLPIGTIVPFIADVLPLGYLLCDGREITQQDYPELYDLLPFGGHISEEIFRSLAKNEVPVMSSNNQDGFIITTSSEYSASYQGWKAFDQQNINDANSWLTQNGVKNGTLTIGYPFKRAISLFKISSVNQITGSKIKTVKLFGVNGDSSEDVLFDKTFETIFSVGETREFNLPFKTKEYKKFKIEVINDDSNAYAGIGELKLYTVDMLEIPNANQDTSKKYLPDLRNMFLRGNKQGRELLSWQNDDNKKHNHRVPLDNNTGGTYEYSDYSNTQPIYWAYSAFNSGNEAYATPVSQETFTGTESRPQNISVNYIIKAKNVSSEDTISPVIDEVNNKIETNRKGLADLKAKYDNLLRGLNETKVLYSQDKYISQAQTLTLTESIKNFKQIEITVMYSSDQYKSTKIHDVRDLTFNDSISATSNVKDVYINTVYGDIYSKLVFRTNGLNIATFTSNAYISKITGIGRIGGF